MKIKLKNVVNKETKTSNNRMTINNTYFTNREDPHSLPSTSSPSKKSPDLRSFDPWLSRFTGHPRFIRRRQRTWNFTVGGGGGEWWRTEQKDSDCVESFFYHLWGVLPLGVYHKKKKRKNKKRTKRNETKQKEENKRGGERWWWVKQSVSKRIKKKSFARPVPLFLSFSVPPCLQSPPRNPSPTEGER